MLSGILMSVTPSRSFGTMEYDLCVRLSICLISTVILQFYGYLLYSVSNSRGVYNKRGGVLYAIND